MNTCSKCGEANYYFHFTYDEKNVCYQCWESLTKAKSPCSCGADKAGVGEWGHSRWCVKSDRHAEYLNIQKMKEEEDAKQLSTDRK